MDPDRELLCRQAVPYFGGKADAAELVWERFGKVGVYIEPFCGMAAVLLGRPTPEGTETINDASCHIVNFWRAMKYAPDDVARWADDLRSEADLLVRHEYLQSRPPELYRDKVLGLRPSFDPLSAPELAALRLALPERAVFLEQLAQAAAACPDPEWYDAQAAGYWAWGASQWIGSGWCTERGRGWRQKPAVISQTRGVVGRADLRRWFEILARRFASVRICCGDWLRVLTDAEMRRDAAPVAIFLDPPYAGDIRRPELYADDPAGLSARVRCWAIERGQEERLRIALCGYEAEHGPHMPKSWTVVPWKARGGYGSQRRDGSNDNASQERIWFSPGCLQGVKQLTLI